MKKRIFGLITALIAVVLSLAAVEALATVWMTIEDGRYTPAKELFERTQNAYVRDLTQGKDCRYVDTLYPHPYLAFVHHANPPCGLPNVNNVGLFGDDFPTVRREDRYVVLVVGGSVASQLVQNMPPPAPHYLERELNENYQSPTGKPFLVLNGGDGAWKEPQSFILFAMFASSVDAVVTLDGFNEHYFFTPGTQERLERPASNFAEVNPFVADENFGDAAIGWVIGRVAGALTRVPLLVHSHAAYMLIRGVESLAKSRDVFKSKKKTTLYSIFHMPDEVSRDNEKFFAMQISLYQQYWRETAAVAREYGVKSAFFVQPFPGWGKTLTDVEKTNVGDISYAPIYRRMAAGLISLGERGLATFDLGDIFQDEKQAIYADDIHCYRTADGASRGYDIMAAAVAKHLAEAWGLKPKS